MARQGEARDRRAVVLLLVGAAACTPKAAPPPELDTGTHASPVAAPTDTSRGLTPRETPAAETGDTGEAVTGGGDTGAAPVDSGATGVPVDSTPPEPAETGMAACTPPAGPSVVLDLDVDLPFATVEGREGEDWDYWGAFGWDFRVVGDVNGDGVGDVLAAAISEVAWEDTADTSDLPEYGDGAVYLVYGPLTDAHAVEDAGVRMINDPEVYQPTLGRVGDVGDLDGDGLSEVTFRAGGYVYRDIPVFFGAPGAAGETVLAQSSEVVLRQYTETFDGTAPGVWIDGGDMDGDGHRDLVIGMDHKESHTPWPVDVWSLDPTDGVLDASFPTIRIYSNEKVNLGAHNNGIGDLNGDGMQDLAMGVISDNTSPYYDPEHFDATVSAGSIRVIYGPLDDGMTLDDFDAAIWGLKGEDIGLYTEIPGDLDGDGRDDIVFGAEMHFGDFATIPGAVFTWTADLAEEQNTSASWARLDGYDGEHIQQPDKAGDLDVDGQADLMTEPVYPFFDVYGFWEWGGGAYLKLGPIPCGIDYFRDAADVLVLPDSGGYGAETRADWSGDGLPDVFISNWSTGPGHISVTTLPL